MKFKKKNKLYSGNIRSIKDIIIRSLIIILFPNLVLIIIFLSVENILFLIYHILCTISNQNYYILILMNPFLIIQFFIYIIYI